MKLGMTRLFDDSGESIAVTVIKAGPCPVVQIKDQKTDGYNALQIAFGQKKERRANKPQLGHLKKANLLPYRFLREIRTDEIENHKLGDSLSVNIFSDGERVDISGISKGRGFTGIMKRWNARGNPASHGSLIHRTIGSVGSSADPSRIFKGKRMPGHMGNKKVTVKNLLVLKSDAESNMLVVKGAVPGPPNGLLIIRKAKI
jgi:large subunit ribosomal protein L3